MFEKMYIVFVKLIQADNTECLEFFKQKLYGQKEYEKTISLMLKYKALKCLLAFAKEISKIDILLLLRNNDRDDEYNAQIFKLFIQLMNLKKVEFNTKSNSPVVNKFTNIPPFNMNIKIYIPIAINHNQLEFLNYFLSGAVSYLDILEISEHAYNNINFKTTHLKVQQLAKSNIEMAKAIVNAAVREITLKTVVTGHDLMVCHLLQSLVSKGPVVISKPIDIKQQIELAVKANCLQTVKHFLKGSISYLDVLGVSEEEYQAIHRDNTRLAVHKVALYPPEISVVIAEAARNLILNKRKKTNRDKAVCQLLGRIITNYSDDNIPMSEAC